MSYFHFRCFWNNRSMRIVCKIKRSVFERLQRRKKLTLLVYNNVKFKYLNPFLRVNSYQ